MNQIHSKFIEAIQRIETTLQIPGFNEERLHDYISLLWSDMEKYIGADDKGFVHVLWALEEFRTHSKYKSLPKTGDLVPLIEKRLFPDADLAFDECCRNVGNQAPEWTHDIVRETSRAMGGNAFKSARKEDRERFSNRYKDNIELWLKGRRFNFDHKPLPAPTNCNMTQIQNFVNSHTNGKGHPSHDLLYYLTKSGEAAEVQHKAALERMKTQPWYQEHVKIHGKEPELPAIPE
jgi:hypothetical protein